MQEQGNDEILVGGVRKSCDLSGSVARLARQLSGGLGGSHRTGLGVVRANDATRLQPWQADAVRL
ncbi:MAG: hypothetical protein ACI841_000165 [Planctomycetota bacterium]|jgi:hypothetical protein